MNVSYFNGELQPGKLQFLATDRLSALRDQAGELGMMRVTDLDEELQPLAAKHSTHVALDGGILIEAAEVERLLAKRAGWMS